MDTRREDWPAWGRLIDEARDGLRPPVSQNEAARRIGITGTHWRHIVKGLAGQMDSPRGVKRLAQMAEVGRVTPEQLAEVGREDVADELRKAYRTEPEATVEVLPPRLQQNPEFQALWDQMGPELREALLTVAREDQRRRAEADLRSEDHLLTLARAFLSTPKSGEARA